MKTVDNNGKSWFFSSDVALQDPNTSFLKLTCDI